jgi:hypothetical protein
MHLRRKSRTYDGVIRKVVEAHARRSTGLARLRPLRVNALRANQKPERQPVPTSDVFSATPVLHGPADDPPPPWRWFAFIDHLLSLQKRC